MECEAETQGAIKVSCSQGMAEKQVHGATTSTKPICLNLSRSLLYPIVRESAESLGWTTICDKANIVSKEINGFTKKMPALHSGTKQLDSKHNLSVVANNKSARRPTKWNIAWHDQSISCKTLCSLLPHQHINHFPGIIELNRKVRMARRLKQMKHLFPVAYSFAPDSWCLPMEETAVHNMIKELQKQTKTNKNKCDEVMGGLERNQDITLQRESAEESQHVFIIKPDKGSQAKGIYLYSTQQPLPKTFARQNEEVVMQRYVNNPLLIEGYKFDLRLYVVITSVDPLRVYLYDDGLVRMCSQLYQPADKNNCGETSMHLTNYTANKKQAAFQQRMDVEKDGYGFKRSIRWLRRWLTELPQKCNFAKLWHEIGMVCARTILINRIHMAKEYRACLPNDPHHDRCFELLGVDVMITEDLRPVLMEVNHSPSLATDTPLDKRIKKGAVTDCLRMLCLRGNEAVLLKKARLKQARRRREQMMANAHKLRGMSRNEKATLKKQEKEAAAAFAAREIEKIAEREYQHRGGYSRIFPPDFEQGYLSDMVKQNPELQVKLERQLSEQAAAADRVCVSTR